MKILIVVPHFVPEIGSAAHIYYDLAKAFHKRGHEVDVITSYPRQFNMDRREGAKECPEEEDLDGIKVHRARHSSTRDNVVMRGMEHFLSPRRYFQVYRRLGKKFDVCLIYIPPLPLYDFAKMIKSYDGTPSVLNYQDFHPQELTDVGVMKNRLLIRYMERLERKSYDRADYITVISEGGIRYIHDRGIKHDRISHIYNGVLVSDLDAKPGKRDFKIKEGIEDKVLVSYAGILSPFQGLDSLLDAAKEIRGDQDVVFYIVGDGMMRADLERRIEEEKLTNVKLLPLQPREEYQNIVNSSDICLVSLDIRMKAPCVPGKLANLLAARKAIVAAVPHDCETAKIVDEAGCGMVVEPGDIGALKDAILKLKSDPELRRILGERGRVFLEKNMDLDKSASEYERVFRKIRGEVAN